jgi:hypothetical protein
LGWTWDYVEDTLTIPRFLALQEYWRDCPPVHLMVAGYLGYKRTSIRQPPKEPPPMLPDVEE